MPMSARARLSFAASLTALASAQFDIGVLELLVFIALVALVVWLVMDRRGR